MRVAVVGVGRMGRPIARRLIAAGHEVYVHNRSRPAVEELVRAGAHDAGSADRAAATCEVVLTVLPSIGSVEAVYAVFGTLAQTGQLFIDSSTVGPRVSRRCAEMIVARSAEFLDAPMSGGPEGAAAGTLTIMVGGSEDVFKRALPLLHVYGKIVRHCGDVGAGQAVKLVNQLLVATHAAAASEAAVLAAKLGLDVRRTFEIVSTAYAASRMLDRNLPRFLSRDFTPDAPIRLFVKDLHLVADAAAGAGAALPLGEIVSALFTRAENAGIASEDVAAIIQLWEAEGR
jgi:3-hydroxyisobutyrate dehydrogenase/2-hydroxy-3-oxopropionate reductase